MRNRILLLPILGVLLFSAMYITAAVLYPGGSQADPHSVGFSWKDNYWCNLFNATAINGYPNPARPVAVIAMIVLAASLQFFWMLVALRASTSRSLSRTIIASAIACNVFIFSLATAHLHDLMVNLASLAGLITVVCVMIVLYRLKWNGLFAAGLFNILLVGLNNFVYYSGTLIAWLPVIQKFTFLVFLCWICLINVRIYRETVRRSAGKGSVTSRDRPHDCGHLSG